MADIDIVEGWTGPVTLGLQADGVAYDLTGKSVALILRDHNGAESIYTTSGAQLEQYQSTGGTVQFFPSTGDLLVTRQPYTARVKVVGNTGQRVFFPNGRGDSWTVYSQ